MKPINTLLAILLGAIATVSPSVLATDAAPKTLEQCATLLPTGKMYLFQMTGTIDMTDGKPVLHGTFSMDDGTKVDRRSEGDTFGKCVAALIK